MSFRISGLEPTQFEKFFSMTDAELESHGARRCTADRKPGFPCRVSLEDAEVGEELILVPFDHHTASSPYRASGPIFVRKAVKTSFRGVDSIPELLRIRLLSLRAYDAHGMMVDADVCQGEILERTIERFFSNPVVCYLHAHNARPGCFNCRIDRA